MKYWLNEYVKISREKEKTTLSSPYSFFNISSYLFNHFPTVKHLDLSPFLL